MKDVFLVNYKVQGIKVLEKEVSLSFYKKGVKRDLDTQKYNIKAIYGMNGSGKSAIVTSVDILRNLIINPGYLNNPVVQKHLEELVNKKAKALSIEADFLADMGVEKKLFFYEIVLSKNELGKYVIIRESLAVKNALSSRGKIENVYSIKAGKISIDMSIEEDFRKLIVEKTANLLDSSSFVELFMEKFFVYLKNNNEQVHSLFVRYMAALFVFGRKIHVFLDGSDNHKEYFLLNQLSTEEGKSQIDELLEFSFSMDSENLNTITAFRNTVYKKDYDSFTADINKMCEFIKIFKPELKSITIDRKEDKDWYLCNLIMNYDGYSVDAEFESTGIKKLISLYTYIREMVRGGIVFIDEFDSNLHDVYLCALLEYLMSYGEGQLCFTTHNVGPMDMLKNNKKSIDFLSVDQKIYPWIKNGNYSPSKLYRSGMIEGSPFNVDSIDFIGVFGL